MTRTNKLTSEERKKRTVQAVIELCQTIEPASITTAVIAEKMGVTQGALFRHFPSKDSIWEEVAKWVSEQIQALFYKTLNTEDCPIGNLESMYMAHISFIAQYPGVPRLLFSQLHKVQKTASQRVISTLMNLYHLSIKQQLARGIERGKIDADFDIESASSMYIGSIQGLVMQALIRGSDVLTLSKAKKIFALYRRSIEKQGN